jgi:ferritin
MLNKKVESALNAQVEKELFSSNLYLAMASWAETSGYKGTAGFLYKHTEEERMHALKFIHYINDRGGHAIVPALKAAKKEFKSVKSMFTEILDHEFMISAEINKLVGICMDERDFTTQNFMQWYVNEQIEEESTFRSILDKLNLLGDDKANMYMFDAEMEKLATLTATPTQGTQL